MPESAMQPWKRSGRRNSAMAAWTAPMEQPNAIGRRFEAFSSCTRGMSSSVTKRK